MKRLSKYISSIYFTTGMIILLSVIAVMSVSTFFSYYSEKERIDLQIKTNAEDTFDAMKSHITDLIASYSVNEYSKYIAKEVQHRHLYAAIIEDRNMGALLGDEVFTKGKIRDSKDNIIDFDPTDLQQLRQLKNAYFTLVKPLTNNLGEPIGTLKLVISDEEFEQRLQDLLLRNLLTALAITTLLGMTLFTVIQMHLLAPLSAIIKTIMRRSDDGLPHDYAPIKGPQEIRTLSQKINHMIDAVRRSRQALLEQSDALQLATDRFQLAVDGTQDGLWDWNLQTNRLYLSGRYQTMLGFEPGELDTTPKKWLEPLHPADLERTQKQISHYLQNPNSAPYENTFRMRAKNGEWHWITARGKALFNPQGEAIRFVGFNTDVTKLITQQERLKQQKQALQFMANHDALTNLANRTFLSDRMQQSIETGHAYDKKFAILFIDLDNFKEINDSLGHNVGDKVLQAVANRLQRLVKSNDTIARLGGDEFTILVENFIDEHNTSQLASSIIKSFQRPIVIDHHELYLGCSIGISLFPDNGTDNTDLLKNADAAMYRAKSLGRNNFQYYSKEMTDEAFERLNMEANIHSGIQNEEFEVYFQPQINHNLQKLIGMEALVRWNHPKLGFLAPQHFIPLAAATGSIIELDRYVMGKTMHHFADWIAQGLNPGRISMNLNMKQLHRDDFIEFLQQLIADTGVAATRIELEVTEGEIMDNPETSIQVLQTIADLGITLSLDDFGTGYSSLSYLKRMPISKLKIDQSFIRELPDDKEDEAIVKAIIALAKSLSIDLLAEGTETEQQIILLNQLGCSNFQGYFYSKPIPAEQMQQYLVDSLRNL